MKKKLECKNCGSIYEIERHKSPVRDKDSEICIVCNEVLLEWNGGVYYTDLKLIERHENHKHS